MKYVIDQFDRKYLKIGKLFIRKAKPSEMKSNFYWTSGSYGMYQINTKYHWFIFFYIWGIMWHRNYWLDFYEIKSKK